jgi:hypothetical protein
MENLEMMPRKKMMTVFGAAVLAIGLTACGGSSTTTPAPEPEPAPEPAGPTDLEQTQADAAAAADATKTASVAAAASAASAADSTKNIATQQTHGKAADYNMQAQMAAAAAMAAYEAAKAAAASAASATDSPAAEDARGAALLAQATAEAEAMKAADAAMKAAEAAMTELMIDGKTKSVGDSSLTIDERTSTTSPLPANFAVGHQVDLSPTETVPAVTAQGGRVDDHNTPADEGVAHAQAVMARTFPVGVVYDSSDDKARMTLFTKYGGTKMAGVFVYGNSTTLATPAAALTTGLLNGNTTPGVIADSAASPPISALRLRSIGMHYPADENDGTGNPNAGTANSLEALDTVRFRTTAPNIDKPREVFSFELGGEERYVVLSQTNSPNTGVTTYDYLEVDITANFVASNLLTVPPTTPGGGTPRAAEQRKVTAAIPMAMEYEHIHFGVWASLADEGTNKGREIDDLGIGFVQNISKDDPLGGMTIVMPNDGTATYTGNWAAAIRSAPNGLHEMDDGDATLTADFGKGTLKAVLAELATLTGEIAGAEFSGTKVTNVDHVDLDAPDSAFDGTFSGAFYGSKAAEAGGIFDFSDGTADGEAFRGAFGGKKQ